MTISGSAPSLTVFTASKDFPPAARSGKQWASLSRTALASLHLEVGNKPLATASCPSPTSIRCVTTQTAKKHIFPLLACVGGVDEVAANTFRLQPSGRHTPATAAAGAASDFTPSMEDQAPETTLPAVLGKKAVFSPAVSCVHWESDAPHYSSHTSLLLPCNAQSELLEWAPQLSSTCCAVEDHKFADHTARACRPATLPPRPSLNSTYLKRLRMFYCRMEGRYGSNKQREHMVPYITYHPPLSIESKAANAVERQDGESKAARWTRPSDCSKPSCNHTSTGGIRKVESRAMYTENAHRVCSYSQTPNCTLKDGAAAFAAGSICRIAGRLMPKGWKKEGWVGWARACIPSNGSPTLSISRSSSLKRNDKDPDAAQNNVFPSKACVRQRNLATAHLTAYGEATLAKVACSTSNSRRYAAQTRAAEKQESQRKSRQHPDQEAVPMEQVNYRRKQEDSKANRGHLQRQGYVTPSAGKQTNNKRRHATPGNIGSKRVRFMATFSEARVSGEPREPSICRVRSHISVLEKQQEQQQSIIWSRPQSSSGRQNSDQAIGADAFHPLGAGESIVIRENAMRMGEGVNTAAVDGAATSIVFGTATPIITNAQRVKKSSLKQKRAQAQILPVIAVSAGALSIGAARCSGGATDGAAEVTPSPASVGKGTLIGCNDRQALCPSKRSLQGLHFPPSRRAKALDQTGSEGPTRIENDSVPGVACTDGSAGAGADLRQGGLLPKTAALFAATPGTEERLQQLCTTLQGPRDWHFAEKAQTVQLWERYEMQQRQQCEENGVRQEDGWSAQHETQTSHLEQQKLRTVQQQCQQAKLYECQHFHQSRKPLVPIASQDQVRVRHATKAEHTETQQMEAQQSEACQLVPPLPLEEDCTQRATQPQNQQRAPLHAGRLSRDAAAGVTSRRKGKSHVIMPHSSGTLSSGCCGSLASSPERRNHFSAALVSTSGEDPQRRQLHIPLGGNSNHNAASRSAEAIAPSSPYSRSTKLTSATAAAAAAAFNALPRARGVWFDAIRNLVRMSWKEGGRVRTAGFPVRKLGLAEARIRAIEYRLFRCPDDPLPSDLQTIVPRRNRGEQG